VLGNDKDVNVENSMFSMKRPQILGNQHVEQKLFMLLFRSARAKVIPADTFNQSLRESKRTLVCIYKGRLAGRTSPNLFLRNKIPKLGKSTWRLTDYIGPSRVSISWEMLQEGTINKASPEASVYTKTSPFTSTLHPHAIDVIVFIVGGGS
jgi:hypothetical protein